MCRILAASRTERVSGPLQSKENESGIKPKRLTRVWVGLIPTTPHIAEGILIEPPVSEPSAP